MTDLKNIKEGTILEIPYVIDNDGDGEAQCEVLEQGNPYTLVKVIDTEEQLLISNETQVFKN
jgi:hypothetical protein